MFKRGWWREIDTLDPITARDPQYNDIRFSFIHRLEANRTQAISEKTLVFYFRNCGSNDTAFRDRFNQRFADRREEIQRPLPDTAALTGQQRNLIEATYDIRVEAYDGFFEAYIAALQQAFVDHALANESLLTIIDEICADSIEDYYG